MSEHDDVDDVEKLTKALFQLPRLRTPASRVLLPKLDLKQLPRAVESGVAHGLVRRIRTERAKEETRLSQRDTLRYKTPRPGLWEWWKREKQRLGWSTERDAEELGELALQTRSGHASHATSNTSITSLVCRPGAVNLPMAGEMISSRRKDDERRLGRKIDPIYSLEHLEKVWLRMSDGLDQQQFVALLSVVLEMNEAELKILFQKMDANGDGSLDWDEFISYLLRESSHRWEQGVALGTHKLEEQDVSQARPSPGVVSSMLVLPPCDTLSGPLPCRYVLSMEESNIIQVWNADSLTKECELPLQHGSSSPGASSSPSAPRKAPGGRSLSMSRTVDSSWSRSSQRKRRNLFPHTGVCPLARSNSLVVSSMDRCISVFSPLRTLAPSSHGSKRYKRTSIRFKYTKTDSFFCLDTPRCLETATLDSGVDMLLIGDTQGVVSGYDLGTKDFISKAQLHSHEQGIRKLRYIPSIGLVSAGMDGNLVIADLEKWQSVRTLCGHKRGVFSFVHCPANKIVISCSFDRQILIWDPYVSRNIGALRGPHNAVVDVLANEAQNQIITASADNKIRVWDIRTWKPIDTHTDSVPSRGRRGDRGDGSSQSSADMLSSVVFDDFNKRLVTASSHVRVWPVVATRGAVKAGKSQEVEPGTEVAGGSVVVAVLFSAVFSQLISVSVDERVILWDVYSGDSVLEFDTDHGAAITSATLDHRGKRLITAAHNGTVKIWNYNNGAKMFDFDRVSPDEISTLLYLPRTMNSVVGLGLGPRVVRWPDPGAPKNTPVLYQDGHEGDVLCVAWHASLLVSGSADGEVIAWYVDSAVAKKRVLVPVTPGSDKRPGVSEMLFVHRVASGEHSLVTSSGSASGSGSISSSTSLLLLGCDDGSVHVLEPRGWVLLASLFEVVPEAVVGLSASDDASRVLVCDADITTKLFDTTALFDASLPNSHPTHDSKSTEEKESDDEKSEHAEENESTENDDQSQEKLPLGVRLVRRWTPHLDSFVTSVVYVPAAEAFVTSSDRGDVTFWKESDGSRLCFLGQASEWPVQGRGMGRLESAEVESEKVTPRPGRTPTPGAMANRRPYSDTHPVYEPHTLHLPTHEIISSSGHQRRRDPFAMKPECRRLSLFGKFKQLEERFKADDEAHKLKSRQDRLLFNLERETRAKPRRAPLMAGPHRVRRASTMASDPSTVPVPASVANTANAGTESIMEELLRPNSITTRLRNS